ncbi:MAG: serine/threonine phosphatase [Microcoleus vaginatus WJT46-NPBG5]|jgi:protein phosphatase|nr:serine/threonine phosphatase [Microcoleus vaginatus WJT46-NPBG5]
MLVCPQCQFENPNTNKFCQKCGTSLSYKNCSQCQSQVALSAQNCPNCGAEAGTVWLAIISTEAGRPATQTSAPIASSTPIGAETSPLAASQAPGSFVIGSDPQPTLATDAGIDEWESEIPMNDIEENEIFPASSFPDPATESSPTPTVQEAVPEPVNSINPTPETASADTAEVLPLNPLQEAADPMLEEDSEASTLVLSSEYLDPQQRYKLLKSLPQIQAGTAETVVKVLDCQPFQMSPLAALVRSGDAVQSRPAAAPPAPTSDTLPITPTLADLAVPVPAQPYLALQTQFDLNLPAIHDAWQQNGQTVMLLEDRSDLPLLLAEWGNDEILPLQLLHWLYEMTELWAALEPWHCQRSLLEVTNLRVNEDRNLCLQRLYCEKSEVSLPLSDLGDLWQMLFSQSQRTQLGSITQLLVDCKEGVIQTVEELRGRLVAIAEEMEISSAPVPVDADDDDEDMPTVVLPMQLVNLQSAGATDVGRQRAHNEDCYGIVTNISTIESPLGRAVRARCLYILCDGMGGHAGGEVASAQAVETLRQYFQTHWQDQLPNEATIREAVLLANQAIFDVNQKEVRSGSGRMGTTLVLVLVQDNQVAVAHVGDSRLYRLSRRQGLRQVTVDHEVGQREIKRGIDPETAYSRPDAYQLTQALGPRDEDFVHPDVQFLELNEDTLLILASDGLTDNDLLETHGPTHLQPLLSHEASLEQGVSELINLANQYNGHDNITAILIRALVQPSKREL